MRKLIPAIVLLVCAVAFSSVQNAQQSSAPVPSASQTPSSQPASSQQSPAIPDLAQLKAMSARFAPTPLRVDTSALSAGDQKALVKLISAARIVNIIFMQQLWSHDLATYQQLRHDRTPLGAEQKHYFTINKGPWSEIDEWTAFLPGVPARKLPGANFYPEDMTKDEFEAWVKTLSPEQKERAEGFFTVIRRGADHQLKIVPYNEEYRGDLDLAGKLLRDAAALTDNDSLKKFLTTRADAFSSNNYYESDMAWMDLDAPVDVTFGPYETYLDEIFGYKAAFEAYINVRDDKETARLAFLGKHLQEIEDNLPEDPQYRNPKLGALAPIRVVNEILSAGDGNHGIATAAYNLPNDDKVVQQKGSKRVMLKNIQEAKFHATLIPISRVVLSPADQKYLSFELFFTHIVAHELCHGLGPHQIKIQGRDTNPRMELKEQYAAWEEAKADVTGLFALQYLMTQADHGKITMPLPHGAEAERKLYTTYLASSFRTMRFGLQDAHARGQAMQFNFFLMKGAYIPNANGTFSLDLAKMKDAVVELDKGLLTAEAKGDYNFAKTWMDTNGDIKPEVKKALARLKSVPTDIEPIFETADSINTPH
jgi:Peptidase family M49